MKRRMLTAADLPSSLPLYALEGVILLPGTVLPLHFFEERHMALLDAALRSQSRLVGVIQPQDENESAYHAIGCAGRIESFEERGDGSAHVTLRGISRFELLELLPTPTPFARAAVDWSDYYYELVGGGVSDVAFDRAAFEKLALRFLALCDMAVDPGEIAAAPDDLLIDSLALMCPFTPIEKQALVTAADHGERAGMLTTLMRFAISEGEMEGRVQ